MNLLYLNENFKITSKFIINVELKWDVNNLDHLTSIQQPEWLFFSLNFWLQCN